MSEPAKIPAQQTTEQAVAIPPRLREMLLRKLDALPRGDVNDIYIALEAAPLIQVTVTPNGEPPK